MSELMNRVKEARAHGASILNPSQDDRKRLASMTAANWQDVEVDEFLAALDYMVAKAAGKVAGEPKAWCYIGTALEAVQNGWKPASNVPSVSSISEGSPEECIRAIAEHPELRRYVGTCRQFDFTQDEFPPFKIEVQLGGTQEERWRNYDRIRAVMRRALREAAA